MIVYLRHFGSEMRQMVPGWNYLHHFGSEMRQMVHGVLKFRREFLKFETLTT